MTLESLAFLKYSFNLSCVERLRSPVVNFITFCRQLFRQYFFAKKLQNQTEIREKLCKALSYKKGESKMLMKLTPGVNFINIL